MQWYISSFKKDSLPEKKLESGILTGNLLDSLESLVNNKKKSPVVDNTNHVVTLGLKITFKVPLAMIENAGKISGHNKNMSNVKAAE